MEAKFYFDNETKWLHSGGEAKPTPPGGIGKFLFEKIKEYAQTDLIAQIQYETGCEETYKSFFTKCVKIALFLKDQDLKPGDIISMSSQNNMNNSAVMMGAMFNGIVLASADPAMSSEDTKYLLGMVDPKLIFVCGKSMDLIVNAIQEKQKKIVTLYEHDTLENLPSILEKYTDDNVKSFEPYFAADNKETGLILFSSGTTGLPKAACISHENLFDDDSPLLRPEIRTLLFSTLYWASSAALTCAILRAGATKVNILQIKPEDTWNVLHKTKCNLTFMVYAQCQVITPYLNQSMPYLKGLCFGGGPLPASYINELRKKLPKTTIFNLYGATEISGIAVNAGQSPPESAGTIIPNDIILKIVDPDTEKAVDLNEIGEIRVKGNHQLTGYYKQESTYIWDAEGFYKTGDLGYLNDKYELYVVDRIKEMFKCAGHLVIPAKIEKVLEKHPAVQHAIVIGVTDEHLAKAFVVLKDAYRITTDELVKYTNDNIEDSKNHLRAGVEFISKDDIEYTVTEKVNRRLLRQKYGN